MKNIGVLSENFQCLEVKFSIDLNRRVFVMPIELPLGMSSQVYYPLRTRHIKRYFIVKKEITRIMQVKALFQ